MPMTSQETAQRAAFLSFIENRGMIGGRYSNVTRLDPVGGGGNFSLVCVAEDSQTGQQVVLKFFNPAKIGDGYRLQCFEREISVLTSVSGQRDIVRLIGGREEFTETLLGAYGVTFDVRFIFYALERAESDAQAAINSVGWSWTDTLTQFRSMVRAVQRLRTLGLAHRDLKPDNFLIVNGCIKLADFGTARDVIGTDPPILLNYPGPPGALLYTAPEMMACLHDVDARIALYGDVFSLGAILFELFTGVPLVLTMFGPGLLNAITAPMYAVPRHQRIAEFENLIPGIAVSNPIPEIGSLNPTVPRSIRPRVDNLIRQLCALDYRQRTANFPSIFRTVDSCLLILRKEQQYAEWQRQAQRRRMQRALKRNGATP